MLQKFLKIKTRLLLYADNRSQNSNDYVLVSEARNYLKIAKENRQSVSKELSKLEISGLIIREKNGNNSRYKLTEHGRELAAEIREEIENSHTIKKSLNQKTNSLGITINRTKLMDDFLDYLYEPFKKELKGYFPREVDPELIKLMVGVAYDAADVFFINFNFVKKKDLTEK